MILPTVGILGLGFLGQEIARQAAFSESYWATKREVLSVDAEAVRPLNLFSFNWEQSGHWARLPSFPSALILTIPPICATVEKEVERLRAWGEWMRQHRPLSKTLVYISTTGVYPNRNGNWDETSLFEPDSLKGALRLATEKTLAEFFNLKVLRAGGIYGKNRHIGHRILSGEPVPEGNRHVHRIHVSDLARIVLRAVAEKTFPSPINVVDLNPAPTATVANWLLNQNIAEIPSGTQLTVKSRYTSRKNQAAADYRLISNRRLLEECHYQFIYPTYQEGFRGIYPDCA
ncbi:MAG: hypothetical protein HQ517_09145 [SAR324 cluster bacterium]|nr:hypothetical protein [SAR324 cluster bacterium]